MEFVFLSSDPKIKMKIMKKHHFLIIVFALLATSCIKSKKKGNCEFHRLEYVELKADGGDMKDDKTILECLQLEVEKDVMRITNETKTISLKFSISDGNIVEDIDIDLDSDIKKTFHSVDEQDMELIEKSKTWEITIKSDNKSRFNGYIKLFKTSDGDYWKQEDKLKDISEK